MSRLIRFLDQAEVNHAALYTGETPHDMAEATGEGLHTGSLAAAVSSPHTEHVTVRRLSQSPMDMTPVLDRASFYLARGERYAFEQLFLFVFVGLTRKVPLGPVFRTLMRHACDHAAAELLQVLRGSRRQPMICSEFVYRCFREAAPPNGGYNISLASGADLGGDSHGLESVAGGDLDKPDSLLGWALARPAAGDDMSESMASPSQATTPAPAITRDGLEKLMAEFLDGGNAEEESVGPSSPDTSDADLIRAIEGFAHAWQIGRQAGDQDSIKESVGEAEGEGQDFWTQSSLVALANAAAAFVTPGDLLRSPSLRTVRT